MMIILWRGAVVWLGQKHIQNSFKVVWHWREFLLQIFLIISLLNSMVIFIRKAKMEQCSPSKVCSLHLPDDYMTVVGIARDSCKTPRQPNVHTPTNIQSISRSTGCPTWANQSHLCNTKKSAHHPLWLQWFSKNC